MPYFFRFLWTDENLAHLDEHDVTPEEFEFVVLTARRVQISRSSGSPMVVGYTAARRRIACVYEEIDASCCLPVTAYEV